MQSGMATKTAGNAALEKSREFPAIFPRGDPPVIPGKISSFFLKYIIYDKQNSGNYKYTWHEIYS